MKQKRKELERLQHTKENLLILVDENDCETGITEKMEAHKKGLLHRAVSVFIFNSKGEMLLQQRAERKYHSPSLWSNACCTHPYPGETVEEAANRRLMEELGLKCHLRYLFKFSYFEEIDELIEHEMDHVFVGYSNERPFINSEEVKDWGYFDVNNIIGDLMSGSDKYTKWFKILFEKVLNEVKS